MEKDQFNFLRKAGEVMYNDLKINPLMEGLSLSVVKFEVRRPTETLTHLFEFIPTYEEANLLAQYAMSEKQDHEIVAILPGWNRSIKTYYPTEYADALVLAKKYEFIKMGEEKQSVQSFMAKKFHIPVETLKNQPDPPANLMPSQYITNHQTEEDRNGEL